MVGSLQEKNQGQCPNTDSGKHYMKVIEVDALNTEPFQGLFNGGPDIFRLAIKTSGRRPEFGSQEHFVSISSTLEPENNISDQ
jgi:hypothetical protein